MSGKMHFQTVDLVASENYSSVLKGTVNAASDPARLKNSFTASPILDGSYDPKELFVSLVLESVVNNPSGDPAPGIGHWGIDSGYSRDYEGPNLLDVEGTPNGGPSGPFTPNAVSSNIEGLSTGVGQETVVNPANEKASRAPFVGNDADSEAAMPSTTSSVHRDTTTKMFEQDIPTGVLGSNTLPPPKALS